MLLLLARLLMKLLLLARLLMLLLRQLLLWSLLLRSEAVPPWQERADVVGE